MNQLSGRTEITLPDPRSDRQYYSQVVFMNVYIHHSLKVDVKDRDQDQRLSSTLSTEGKMVFGEEKTIPEISKVLLIWTRLWMA